MHGLASLVSGEQWETLLASGVPREFAAGAVLMRQGEHADHVLLLTRGRVKVWRVESDGSTLVLAVRCPGELLGEIGLLNSAGRSASVTAIDDCAAQVIEAGRFRAVVRSLELEDKILQHMAGRLLEGEDHRSEMASLQAGPRVRRYLYRLASHLDVPAGEPVDVGLNQTDLAQAVGLARQTVAVEISYLRKRGVIDTSRNRVVVTDLGALAETLE